MKVLVRLNHDLEKSYLLGFKNSEIKSVRTLLESPNKDSAIPKLMAKSTERIKITAKERRRVQNLADFTLSQHGYSIERLA